MNLNLYSYLPCRTSLNDRRLTLLVDTGADISVLKLGQILNGQIDETTTTQLSGVGQGLTTTLGKIHTDLKIEELLIPHSFHVVEDDFPIPSDGIIGMDFLREYKCLLDYQDDQDWIVLRSKNLPQHVAIAMRGAPQINSISLPARSEVIRQVNIQSDEENVLIPNQIIQNGIFIASTIVSKSRPLVKIVNTTNKDVVILNTKIQTESLNDYKIVHPIRDPCKDQEKLNRLLKHFPEFAKDNLRNLCSEYVDIFGLESEKMTSNNFYKQKLRLKDSEPVYIKSYRIPHTHKAEVCTQVDKLIEDDIVEPSISEYNSPILLVPKKSLPGTNQKRWRLVVDYRGINKKLVADKFPLPRIDDILDQLGRAKFFSCLDLMSGFHQIELEEGSRDVTSFSTDKGSFRFKRLPYGMKIAPNSFQRMMSLAFSGLSPEQAFLYMDDLIVIGCSEQHMLKNLRNVFETCRKYNLKLHPDKCTFFCNEVTFLGHKCTDKGILPDDGKFSVILNYPRPKNGDEAKRFVAFCNYYRRFIPNFANHSRHITRLCRKNIPFDWNSECEKAFNYLKNQLLNPTILQYPDFEKEFCITTDASKFACGAVLSQKYCDKQLPVAYASRSFTKGESNKSTIEQELAAIHWAIKYFRPYIYGRKFLIRSDHRPLTYLFSMKDPSSKLTRMRLDLEEYEFTVEYIRGNENHAADALSRLDFEDIKKAENGRILKVTTRLQSAKNFDKVTDGKPNMEPVDIRIYEAINAHEYNKNARLHFTKDRLVIQKGKTKLLLFELRDFITNGKVDLGHLFPKLEKVASNLKITTLRMSLDSALFANVKLNHFKEVGNEKLQKLNIVLVPPLTKIVTDTEKRKIMEMYHDNPLFGGHPGITRMLRKIRLKYHWKNMTRDITRYVKSCAECQKNKAMPRTRELMVETATPIRAFDTIIIDTIGPFMRSNKGNEYAVTIICDLTKYLVTVPIPDKSARTVAKAIFEGFVLIYGPMRKMISDMGTEYKNQTIKELCQLLNIDYVTSTAYHHQTLGTIERSHRTFNEYVRSYISSDRTDWDEWLAYFTYCFNTTPSTVHNYCPYELVFGKMPPSIDTLKSNTISPLYNIDSYEKEVKYRLQTALKRASVMLDKAKLTSKSQYDKTTRPISVKIGDLVLLEDNASHKLEPLFKGPFEIKELDDHGNCLLALDDARTMKVHKNRLRQFQS